MFYFCSCGSSVQNKESIATISIDNAEVDNPSFIQDIEIIPLETTDSLLIGNLKSFKYVEALDSYFISDTSPTLFLFDSTGKHLSNSLHCQGQGPQEYIMITNVLYNQYENQIEIFDTANKGIIHCYDLDFNWKNTIKLNFEEKFTVIAVELLDSNRYLLEPVRIKEEDCYFVIKTIDEDKTKVTFPNNYVAGVNMVQNPFTKTENNIYYTPCYLDYYLYELDSLNGEVNPIYKLDIEDDEKIKKRLIADFGNGNSDNSHNRNSNLDISWKKNDYLLTSSYRLPIIRLISESYVYVHLIKNKKPSHILYNRKTGETHFLSEKTHFPMYRCFQLIENVLYTLISPHEIEKYINNDVINFLSETEIEKLENIKEDDNPVVVKYILK